MYRTSVFSSLFIIFFSIALLAWIIPAQSPAYPGYGMPASLMPNILTVIMLLCAVANLVKTIITRAGSNKPAQISVKVLLHCLAFVAVMAAAMPLMTYLGYAAGGALVMLACCLLCGERSLWRMALIVSVTLSLVYLALWKGLNVMLP